MNRKDSVFYLGFALILILAFSLRFYHLDERVFHHDEAAVGFFTYKLFNEGIYSYDPSFHGPFMYYVTAEMYRRFGDTEYTSRILPALFGTFMLLLLIPLRKHLGNRGMVLAAFFLALSPSFLYYSRFYREDIFISFFTLLTLVCAVKYAERYAGEDYIPIRGLYLALGAAVLASILALWVELPSIQSLYADAARILVYITAALVMLFIVLLEKAKYSVLRFSYLFLGAFSLASMAALKENAYVSMVLIALFLVLFFIGERWYRGLVGKLKGRDKRTLVTAGEGLFFVLAFLVIFSLFYTGKVFDFYGMKVAVEKAISHWYEMHSIQRMGGPYYFYLPIIALYELPILIFGILGIAHFCAYGKEKEKVLTVLLAYWVAVDILYIVSDYYPASGRFLPTSYIPSSIVIFFPLLILGIIIVLKSRRYLFSWDNIPGNDNGRLIESLIQRFGVNWVKTAKIEKIDNGGTIKLIDENNFLLLKLNNEQTEVNLEINDSRTYKFIAKIENNKLNIYSWNPRNLFFAFLAYWAITNLVAYSYVQEKVPWLVLNPLLPLAIVAAAYIGEFLPRLKFNSKAGVAVVIFLFASLSYFAYSSVLLNYYKYTDPAEPLIQAAQPPQRFSEFLDEIKVTSSQYQNQSTPIQVTDVNMETQFLWYLRHYSSIKWKVSTDSELNAPLIVVHDGDGNNSEANTVEKKLGSGYQRLNSAKMSWYWFQTSDITSPTNLLNYLLYRKVNGPPGEYRVVLFYRPKAK